LKVLKLLKVLRSLQITFAQDAYAESTAEIPPLD